MTPPAPGVDPGAGPRRRAAFVGCGKIAGRDDDPGNPHVTTHARALRELPDHALAACCDPDPGTARAFADRWGVPRVYPDLAAMLADRAADVYVLSAATSAHARLLAELLAHPEPVTILCEKPLVETPEEWRRLAPALRATRHAFAVNFPRRFDPAHRELREIIRGGSLGELLHFHAGVAKGILHNGSHMVDLLLFLLGPIASLAPITLRAMPAATGHGTDLAGTVLCRLASGAEGVLAGTEAPGYSYFELDLVFARGKVEIRRIGHDISIFAGRPSAMYPGFSDLEKARALAPTYDKAFLGAYRALAEPGFAAAGHGEDALRGMDLLMGLMEAAAAAPPGGKGTGNG